MTLHDGSRLISAGHHNIVRDVSAWLSVARESWRTVGALWAARRRRARELRELYRFSDRELLDVGLSRSDIPAIQKGYYRRD